MEFDANIMTKVRQNWQMFTGAMPEDKIEKIISAAGNTEKASTFNNGGDDVRTSRVSWLTGNQFVLDELYHFVFTANSHAFYTNIYKKADVQFTEYLATEGGHYSWHHDIDWNRCDGMDRKLSVTVQLSSPDEYEGGDFSFSEVESPDERSSEKGTVLIFPSYLQHRVKPITKGVRRSLVAWFEGPAWQ